ncbi:MAG: hypothetical protein ACJAWV_002620 [Flammeovirgaceae bacterium]|jgi:hypothetical protein
MKLNEINETYSDELVNKEMGWEFNGLYKNSKGLKYNYFSDLALSQFYRYFYFNRQIVNLADFVNMHQLWV